KAQPFRTSGGKAAVLSCFDLLAKRECQFYALVTMFHSYSARRSGGRRGHFAQTASARGRRAPTFRRNLFVFAARSTHRSESDADSARRNEPHRWPGILSAGSSSGRDLARVRPLGRDR